MSDALVISLIVGVALVAVAAAAALTRGTALVDTDLRFRSPLDADSLRAKHLNDLLAALSDQGYALGAVAADEARFHRHHRPAWTIYVAVLFWPVGVIALLRRERVTVHVRAEPTDEGTLVVVAGTLTQSLRDRLRYALGAPEERGGSASTGS